MMQNSLSGAGAGGTHIRTDNLNGNHGLDRSGLLSSNERSFILEQVDPSQLGDDNDDSHSDSEATDIQQLQSQHAGDQHQDGSQLQMDMGIPKPTKKTKGRVKIKMEFIENKLRRYTTFSKRKTGIMKKAYELSTLTGTQVMLLVASETGHVYTFATRKLQPMITSESGKALIQTCLNSPDQGASNGPQGNIEQRMNPTGFEETELTYTVAEEEAKPSFTEGLGKPLLSVPGGLGGVQGGEGYTHQVTLGGGSQPYPVSLSAVATSNPATVSPTPTSSPPTIFLSQPPQAHANPTPPPQSSASGKGSTPSPSSVVATSLPTSISMQLPQGILLQTGGTSISFPLQQTTGQTAQTTQAQTIFGLPNQTQYLTMANLAQQGGTTTQADNTAIVSSASSSSSSATSLTSVPSNISLVSASGSGSSGGLMTPNLVMYQTPQGVVYATPASATLNDRIFNFQQPATAISLPQQDNAQVGAGQLIIPIPVSLSGSGQQFLQFASPTEHSATTTTVADLTVQPPRAKKSRSK